MTLPGDHLGPYELLRPLGAGGMAETFVAIRRGPANFEQRVCLKRILPGCAADPMFVELFLDEARLLARLQCANIVHVYDFGEVQGTYYMALELIDGVDLEGLLSTLRERGERMPEQVALYIVTEILVALSYAHTLEIDGEPQGIVHRDISPSNILLSKTGEVKLTDFGIAKARGRSHRTQTGHTKGKVAYMSPEQVRAEELDGRSDLFAIGVVLFELLTGAHPFDANTDFALQVNIMSGKRRPLRELLPHASEPVAQLVDALLATDRKDRPESAADAIALIPPLEAQFKLQRGLEALVKQRIGIKGSAASTGSAPRPLVSGVGPAHSSTAVAGTPAGTPSAVMARGTTAGAAPKRSLKPALWIALAALVLALGFALGRRGEVPENVSATHHSDALPAGQYAPPAIPDAPTPRAAVHAPAGAVPVPPGSRAPGSPPDTVQASPEGHGGKHGHRHDDHHRSDQGARAPDSPAVPPAAPAGEPEAPPPIPRNGAPPPLPASPAVPSIAAPAVPAPGPALTPVPRDDSKPAPRTPYITPSGRVVIPAPPL
ncbi:MAG: serine/threonine protein kinase [Myxococcaceae bacterium]|nr:serine/threonine protein kinase [Myxococcaceae bacterium]